jgi:hypothetical protein
MNQPFFSICIPTWEIRGIGSHYLEYSFNILAQQTFKDFDIIISDNSYNNSIKEVCDRWSSLLDIKYFLNEEGRGFISPNLNYGLSKCTGKYIKILFQDDFLYNENSLNNITKYLQDNLNINWLVTGCGDTPDEINFSSIIIPKYHSNIHLGKNTIGCPSVLTIKNDENKIFFDNSLVWLNDVDYYKKCYDKFGPPGIIPELGVVIRVEGVSVSSLLKEEIKKKEYDIMLNKYGIL